jgi:uncharacterized protein (DUF302 family)
MESQKPFDKLIDDLQEQVAAAGFRVLAIHDVQNTLAEKGLERGPLKIVEVCNAKFAHEATKKEIGAAAFMPCRYTVHTSDDKTVLTLARPTMLAELMPGAGLRELATEVEEILRDVMVKTV